MTPKRPDATCLIFADALSPFGEVPVDLPLTPVKLLSVVEGRDLATQTAPAKAPESNVAQPSVDTSPSMQPEQGAMPASEAVVIDGTWNMVLSTPMGPQEMTGYFSTEDDVLSGCLESPEGKMDFTGKVDGDQLMFDIKTEKPVKITLKYKLAVTGDKISGKCKMGIFGSAKVNGERVVGD